MSEMPSTERSDQALLQLSEEVLLRICGFLRPSELLQARSSCCRFETLLTGNIRRDGSNSSSSNVCSRSSNGKSRGSSCSSSIEYFWKAVCEAAAPHSLNAAVQRFSIHATAMLDNISSIGSSSLALARVAVRLERAATLRSARWTPLSQQHLIDRSTSSSNSGRLGAQEAHAMAAICDGRFVAVVGGWGVSHSNRVHVIDAVATQQQQPQLLLYSVQSLAVPRFRYGCSAVEFDGSLLVFGGCSQGGYSGAVNDLYRVDFSFQMSDGIELSARSNAQQIARAALPPIASNTAATATASVDLAAVSSSTVDATATTESLCCDSAVDDPDAATTTCNISHQEVWVKSITARYSHNLSMNLAAAATSSSSSATTAGVTPLSRGYHSSCVVQWRRRNCMLVWGGLHDDAPVAELQLLDLQTLQWHSGAEADISGQEPQPRFGHSSVLVAATDVSCCSTSDRVVFAGGSDGNDLVRNGRELREIHILTIQRAPLSNGSSSGDVSGERMVWSSPVVDFLPAELSAARAVPGRCHCAAVFGRNVVYFSGGARHSSAVSVLAIAPTDATAAAAASEPGADVEAISLTMWKPRLLSAKPSHEETVAKHQPDSSSSCSEAVREAARILRPLPRCSAACAAVGSSLLVFGGFSTRHRYFGDAWSLDLAVASDEVAADRHLEAAETAAEGEVLEIDAAEVDGDNVDDDYEEEEDEDEDDEYGGIGNGGGGGVLGNLLMQLIMAGGGGDNGGGGGAIDQLYQQLMSSGVLLQQQQQAWNDDNDSDDSSQGVSSSGDDQASHEIDESSDVE